MNFVSCTLFLSKTTRQIVWELFLQPEKNPGSFLYNTQVKSLKRIGIGKIQNKSQRTVKKAHLIYITWEKVPIRSQEREEHLKNRIFGKKIFHQNLTRKSKQKFILFTIFIDY